MADVSEDDRFNVSPPVSLQQDTTLTSRTPYVQVDTTNGPVLVTLPSSGPNDNTLFIVEKTQGTASCTVQSGDLIDGTNSVTVDTDLVVWGQGGTWTADVDAVSNALVTAEIPLAPGNNGYGDSDAHGGGPVTTTQQVITLASRGSTTLTHPVDSDNSRLVQTAVQTADVAQDSSLFPVTPARFGLQNPNDSEILSGSFTLKTAAPSTTNSNMSLGGTAFASSSTQPAANGNDDNTGNFWYNASAEDPTEAYWGVVMSSTTALYTVEVNWYSQTYAASSMVVEGSNDGSNWTVLDTFSVTYAATTSHPVSGAPHFYTQFRLRFPTTNNTTYVVLREGRFLGGVPSTSTLNTTDTYAVSTTSIATDTWASVLDAQVMTFEPASSSLTLLASFDGRSTWKAFDGTAWTAWPLTDIATSPMTSSRWTNASWTSELADTLDVAVWLSTSSGEANPSFSGVTFRFQTPPYFKTAPEQPTEVRWLSDSQVNVRNTSDSAQTVRVNVWTKNT